MALYYKGSRFHGCGILPVKNFYEKGKKGSCLWMRIIGDNWELYSDIVPVLIASSCHRTQLFPVQQYVVNKLI